MAKMPNMNVNSILSRIQVGITLNGLNVAEGLKVLAAVAALEPQEAVDEIASKSSTPIVVVDDAVGPKTTVTVQVPVEEAKPRTPRTKAPKEPVAPEPEPSDLTSGHSGTSAPEIERVMVTSDHAPEPWLVDLGALPEAITGAKNLRSVVKWFVAAGTTDEARIMREIKRMAEGGGPTFFVSFLAGTDPAKKIRDALELIATLGS